MRETENQLFATSPVHYVNLRRTLDILCAGTAASALAPVFLIVAIAIWIEGGRPILFSQLRLGQNGRPFRIYKFRKFGPNCDLHGYPLTMDGDGRLTAIGRILAATKLDELPQLWNVFRGDMSLVGPRPESLVFIDCFRNGFEKILEHKPGLFGPCQVLFRHENKLYPNDISAADFYRQTLFPEKAKVDLAYFSRRTLASDLGWILRAARVIAMDSWATFTRSGSSNDSSK
ncbi:sugar transferase [Tardiphaga sp.]|uniref:sugar transferase n=1 Tax=Tardiphaga sp. TaxID=1926292 RepID=UPI0026233329|nr:sugar transferase [Tardiphaga sp.]